MEGLASLAFVMLFALSFYLSGAATMFTIIECALIVATYAFEGNKYFNTVGTFCLFLWLAYLQTRWQYSDFTGNDGESEERYAFLDGNDVKNGRLGNISPSGTQALHGNPIFFPSTLRHMRKSGFKDDFQHSYLYVGVPVGLHARYGPFLSVDEPLGKAAIFSIQARDQALRGGSRMTLPQKLKEYLKSQVS